MTMGRSLVWLVGLVGCTGTTGPDGPVGPFNFDMEIDGGGQDYNAPNPDWEPDTDESFDVKTCMAANGTLYAVWYKIPYVDDGGKMVQAGFADVYFNRSTDGGKTWLPDPIRVKQGPGDASGVDMACLGDRVYVVWEDDRDGETGYQNIYLNFSTDGGDTWEQDDKALDNDPDGYAISLGPKLALFEGQVHVVWYDQVEGAPDVFISTSVNGGRKFNEPVRISNAREDEELAGTSWNGNPQIVIDAQGVITVVWESTRNGRQDIFSSTSTTGGQTFGPQKRVDTGDERGANYSFAPRVGVSNGNVYVVWHDSRSGARRDVYMNYSADSGANWLESAVRVESLSAEGFTESIFADVVVDGDVAHIVWQDADAGAGYDIYYRRATAGVFASGDDGKEVRIDGRRDDDGEEEDKGEANSTYPRIVKAGSILAVAWSDYRNDAGAGYNDLFYNYIDLAAETPAWLSEDLGLKSLDKGRSFTEDHSIFVRDGELFTTWVDGRNGNRDVFFSRVALGEAVESLDVYTEAQGK